MGTAQASRSVLIWSVAIAGLATVASLAGLLAPSVYAEENANWTAQARGQDLGNLVAAATLLVSGVRAAHGSYRAALVWLGTLFYFVYAYVIYALAVHVNSLFLVYVAVLGLSVYALVFRTNGLRLQDADFPSGRRLAVGTLVVVGLLFAILWLAEIVPALVSDEVPASVLEAGLRVNPVHVIDLSVVLPGFVLSGWLALRGDRNGLFFAGPWLVFSVLMGTSIVATMVLMTVEGFEDTVPPMVMVSAVVLVSLAAAWRLLNGVVAPASPVQSPAAGS